MNRDQLAGAVQLREEGRAKQEPKILERARSILLELVATYPDDPEVNFQVGAVYDNLGLGRDAVPYYVRAIDGGLAGADLERCLLAMGSTYRYLGLYQEAASTLQRGVREYPDNQALRVLLAMALYNTHQYREALELVLNLVLEASTDEKIQYFKRGLQYYAQNLDEVMSD